MRAAFEDCLQALSRRGAEIVMFDDPIDFERVIRDHRLVMAAEAANVHSDWLDEFPDDYPHHIRDLVIEGRSYAALDYLRARQKQGQAFDAVAAPLDSGAFDAIITPAAIGIAPDPATTGDPAFNSPWSFTGLPTVSFPIGRSRGMPVGLQIVGGWWRNHEVLRTAEWCEDAIRDPATRDEDRRTLPWPTTRS
jgi:Asp-tRNA(Asn)/Glu-tRNA(Gln) amidotransferase A subunit family amidase